MVIFSCCVVLFSVIIITIITFQSVREMINYNIDRKSWHAFICTSTSKFTYIRSVSLARSPSRAKRTITLNQPCCMTYVCSNYSGGSMVVASKYIILCDYMWERWRERVCVFLYQHNTKHILPKVLGDITLFTRGARLPLARKQFVFAQKDHGNKPPFVGFVEYEDGGVQQTRSPMWKLPCFL